MTRARADEPGAYRLIVRFGAEIMEEGFTSVPNLVLNHYASLGITGAEMLFIIHVWQFWWSERENPHPSSRVLAERMGVDQRTIRNYTASLETKGVLTTHERIIPGEGQRANVYDFAKLLKAVTKAAKMGGNGSGGTAAAPRKDPSGEGRKEISGGRRKNISAQRLKKLSGEGRKEGSGLEYVVEDQLMDEDTSNIRQAPIQQKRGRERPRKEGLQSFGDPPESVAATVPPAAAAPGDGYTRPPMLATPGPPEPPSRENDGQGDGGLVPRQPSRATPSDDDGAAALVGDPAREELHGFAEVVAREFNDQAPFRATLSRIVNIYHRAGLPPEEFTERLDAARQRTKERTGAVRALAGDKAPHGVARKNKMPYFFAIFENLLGLRESPSLPAPSVGEGEIPAGGESTTIAADRERLPARRSSRGLSAPEDRPAPAPKLVVAGTPAPASSGDTRLIKDVVSTFSRQFSDYAAAEALGEWAVTLWQRSHLSREHFLAAATEASEQLLHDQTTAPSAAQFQNCLMKTVEQLGGGKAIEPLSRGEAPARSAPPADGAGPRDQPRA